jgi:hypothetical protein
MTQVGTNHFITPPITHFNPPNEPSTCAPRNSRDRTLALMNELE